MTFSNLSVCWMSEFNENFYYNLRVFLLRLSFLNDNDNTISFLILPSLLTNLIDDDVLHVPILAALLLYLLLKLLVHLVTAHHVLETQHPTLSHATPRT